MTAKKDLTYIKLALQHNDLEEACELLIHKCKMKPYLFAANVAQLCGWLAEQNKLNDIEKLMNYLRDHADEQVILSRRRKL